MLLKVAVIALLLFSVCAAEDDVVKPEYTKKVAAFEQWYKGSAF